MSKFEKRSLADEIWNKKYRFNNETWNEFVNRIHNEFKINYNDNLKYSIDDINSTMREMIDTLTIIPGGSVLSSVGTPNNCSLSNCFVVEPPSDSMESIFNTARDISQIYKRRGGAGLDVSKLRPNGAKVNNSAKTTSGPVSFMDLYSHVTNITGQNARRGALMISIDINHPDSPEFIESKQDLTKITGANISVKVNKEFYSAVKKNEDYVLRWPLDLDISNLDFSSNLYKYNKLYEYNYGYIRVIKANELWNKIIHCAWNTAEPGVLFWDNIMENDPASYYPQFRAISTNPCGEIPLGPYDSCRLIAVNLYKFIDNPYTDKASLDINKVYKTFYIAQIMGDRLVDLELEKVKNLINLTDNSERELWSKIYQVGQYGRRTGIGFTGYADMLAALNLDYGNESITKLVMQTMYRAELDATIDLAKVNSPFPCYNKEIEFDNPYTEFIKTEFPAQYERMKVYGRRNVSWSTVAPTGSISILTQTSSGIEPQFSLFYKRRVKCIDGEKGDYTDLNGVQFKTHFVIAQSFIDWMKVKGYYTDKLTEDNLNQLYVKSPWYKNCASDIDPVTRVNTQALIQRYITHSISSTCNLSEYASEEDVDRIYNKAFNSLCKGITIYRDKCRSGILIKEDKPKQENTYKEEEQKYNYIVPVSRKQMGITSGSTFCKKCACGTLYITCNRDEQGNLVEVFTHTSKGGICQANLNAETRMISLALRSGVKVDEIVDQLRGITCPACTIAKAKKNDIDGISCADIISRTITEFQNRPVCPYPDDEVTQEIRKEEKKPDKEYEECPECHSKSLIREGGCKQCLSCGYSACS